MTQPSRLKPREAIETQLPNETDLAYAKRLLELYRQFRPFEESDVHAERALFARIKAGASGFRERFRVTVGQAADMTEEQLQEASAQRRRSALSVDRDRQYRASTASRGTGAVHKKSRSRSPSAG